MKKVKQTFDGGWLGQLSLNEGHRAVKSHPFLYHLSQVLQLGQVAPVGGKHMINNRMDGEGGVRGGWQTD